MDDVILIKAKEALQSALAAGDTARADVIKQKTVAYIQRKGVTSPQAGTSGDAAAPPKDTSYTSAIQQGLDAPLENIGQTLKMVGADRAGSFLQNLTEAPKDYQPAQVTAEGDRPWYDPRAYNWSEVPRAAAEQAGQFAGSLATRAGGAAIGGAISAPSGPGAIGGAAVGAIAGPAMFEAVQVAGPVAKQLAEARGREGGIPTAADWAQAVATAAGSGAVNALIPGSKLLRPLAEGATEAVQSAIEQVGGSAGTPEGIRLDPKQAVAEGLTGGTAAGGFSAAPAAKAIVSAPVEGAKALVAANRSRKVNNDLEKNPEQTLSEQRLLKAVEEVKATAVNAEDATGEDADSKAVKVVLDGLETKARSFVDMLDAAGMISRAEKDGLASTPDNPIATAKKHNRFLLDEGANRIAAIPGVTDEQVSAFRETMIDLNTASQNGLYRQRTGPVERVGKVVGAVGGGKLGLTVGGLLGAPAGAATGAAVGSWAGRKVDKAIGVSSVPGIRRARARAATLDKMGIEVAPAGSNLKDAEALLLKQFGETYGVHADSPTKAKLAVAEMAYTKRKEDAEKAAELRREAAAEEANTKRLEKLSRQIDDGFARDGMNRVIADQKDLEESRRKQAKAVAAAEKLEAAIKANDEFRQRLGGALEERGESRAGGWHIEAVKKIAEDYPQLKMEMGDFQAGLNDAVERGLMTKTGADRALKVPGYQIGDKSGDGTYLHVVESAMKAAADRQGLPWDDNARMGYIQEAPIYRAEAVGRASARRKAGRLAEEAAIKAEKRAAASPRPKRVPKAKPTADPVAAALAPTSPSEDIQGNGGSTTTGNDNGYLRGSETPQKANRLKVAQKVQEDALGPVRDRVRWTATKSDAKELTRVLYRDTPEEFHPVVEAIASEKSKSAKAELYKQAVGEHPDMPANVKRSLRLLAQAGGV